MQGRHKAMIIGLVKLMRPKQWIKNAFLFPPLLFTGEFLHSPYLLKVAIAFILFCIASSATYIINDIRDRDRDRKHPTKSKQRPIAAGWVTIPQALSLLFALYLLLIIGYVIAPKVVGVIVIYSALNFAYTFFLKHQPVIDIFCIALGFVLRVYAGAVAISVPVSSWMFVTTLCLALYLASIKRRQELLKSGSEGRKVLAYYSVGLVDRYAQISAIGALLFYSLFVLSSHPNMVITIPCVLYGLFRYWFVVDNLDSGESPTDAVLADWQLLLIMALWAAICGYVLG